MGFTTPNHDIDIWRLELSDPGRTHILTCCTFHEIKQHAVSHKDSLKHVHAVITEIVSREMFKVLIEKET